MSDDSHGAARSGPGQRSAELGVAVVMALFALLVIYGSIQAGIGWGAEGPKAGFFPFYVGIAILIASAVNFVRARGESSSELFADWGQLRQVLAVVVPTAVYVAVIPWIGLYVASLILIAFFMKRLGNYGWHQIAAIAIGLPLVAFVVFERWFLVPLPKGPIEAWLGF
ncbi:MAG: tripartite tricarboxylate transporter TctB family protein [Alphaproteobacteria bacterium]|nr:tripartite tricarboxylate transporter TctB family protein [Alphaproteobacteria bacterium]